MGIIEFYYQAAYLSDEGYRNLRAMILDYESRPAIPAAGRPVDPSAAPGLSPSALAAGATDH